MSFNDPLLKVSEVAELCRKSVPGIYRDMQRGILPRPLKLGGSSRWPQSEILAAIEAAKAARAPTK